MLSRWRAGRGACALGHARLAIVMNIRVVGTLSRPFFARWGVAAILACAVGYAAAAPNPVSGPKSSEGYQTAHLQAQERIVTEVLS